MIKYCLGFVFDEQLKNVMLIKKEKPTWQRGQLNGLGGHIYNKEWASHAMQRTCLAESGMNIQDWTKVYLMDFDNCELYVFVAVADLSKATTMTGEEIKIMPIADFGNFKLVAHTSRLLQCALDTITNG